MSDGMNHVRSGERFSPVSSAWNRIIDATLDFESIGSSTAPPGISAITVANVSEDRDFDRFDAVELVGPLVSSTDDPEEYDLASFEVNDPEDPQNPGRMAILQEPIARGDIGRALLFGVTAVRELEVVSESHTRAVIGVEGALKTSDDGEAVILWKDPQGTEPVRRGIVAVLQGRKSTRQAWIRLLGETMISPNKWSYDFELVEIGPSGDWDRIEDHPSASELGKAQNTLEAGNTGSGVEGNGVAVENLPSGFSIRPIGGGAVVRARGPFESPAGPASPPYWLFTVANLVDGSCE